VLPSRRFHRAIGAFAGAPTDPSGQLLPQEEWNRRRSEWLPGEEDETYVKSLMRPVHERGKIAQWIAPPRRGINGRPFDFEYVRLDD
jgi:benzoyl-CoA 2,3-dioxygenase component B